jgi:hypothetical protein
MQGERETTCREKSPASKTGRDVATSSTVASTRAAASFRGKQQPSKHRFSTGCFNHPRLANSGCWSTGCLDIYAETDARPHPRPTCLTP